jgi:DNA primase small subunit
MMVFPIYYLQNIIPDQMRREIMNKNRTVDFLKSKFVEYYGTSTIELPERFTRREWGFLYLGETFMQRHLSFRKNTELIQFLTGKKGQNKGYRNKANVQGLNIPAHVYYSSAYYQEPGLQPMPAKVEGWLGADLIFDLDDDHLRNIEGLTPIERLEKVKYITRYKLLDDFILGDLGFDEKYIRIAFSGSRGYHIHIRDPNVFSMSSAERREIVDYLTGTGLNLDRIFPDEVYDTKEFGGKKYSKKPKLVTPKLTSPGWRGRMARGILELINSIAKLPEDKGLAKLNQICRNLRYKGKPIPPKEIEEVYHEIFSRARIKIDPETFEKRNILEIFPRDKLRDIFLEIVREHQKIEMAGETDEPVTTDVKRLIRLPTSLHGKTGFRVVPLTIDELKDFSPFKDALAFGEDPISVKITIQEPFSFKLGGEEFLIKPGENSKELPEFAAIYLMCQRKAVLG